MLVIFHNPKCSTSRHVLDAIRASGTDVAVIEYLKEGWTKPLLLALFAAAAVTPRDALRMREPAAKELADADPDTILDAMVAAPVLVQRPFVIGPRGATLCRPAENLLPLLAHALPAGYVRSDGKPFA